MRAIINLMLTLSVFFFVFSCNNNSSGPEDTQVETEMTGKVQAPDESTPIQGATVYVGESLPDDFTASGNCVEPPVDYEAFTCTDSEGNFEFTVTIDRSSNEVSLKVFKGSFKFEKTVEVSGDGSTDAGNVNVTDDAIDMAVVTGSYDRMQDILAKVGFGDLITDQSSSQYGQLELGTEQFDLYSGDFSLPSDYPEMGALFEDNDGDGEADINNYDIVFINCGASEQYVTSSKVAHQHSHEEFAKSVSKSLSKAEIATVRSFIENGGTLYATDLAYDYVEQSYPSYIDFLGDDSTPASDPEQLNAAEEGVGGITVDATVLDSDLETWLGNVSCKSGSCLNSDQTVHVEDFLGAWAVIDGFHTDSNTKSWIEGSVEWYSGSGVKPLTVSFQANSGKLVFSSYHTIESEFSPEFRPQERILQYLVFE